MSLESVSPLFTLIDGITYVSYADENNDEDTDEGIDEEDTIFAKLPDKLDDAHFVRFHIYASHVTEIKLGVVQPSTFKTENCQTLDFLNWPALLEYTEAQVLLPRLARVSSKEDDPQLCMLWLRVLLSPSVEKVALLHPTIEWSVAALVRILAIIAINSPDLPKLFINVTTRTPRAVERNETSQQMLAQAIGKFCSLQELLLNSLLFHTPVASTVAQLSKLETLYIGGVPAPPLVCNPEWSTAGFPSLQGLRMSGICPSWIPRLEFMKLLLGKAEILTLETSPKLSQEVGAPEVDAMLDQHWANPMLLKVIDNAPRVRELTITSLLASNPTPLALISQEVQESLRQLPIVYLHIDDMHFGDIGGPLFLSSAWNGIEDLYCRSQKCELEDLVLFSRNLPHLSSLELDIDMSGAKIPRNISAIYKANNPNSNSHLWLSSGKPRLVERTSGETMILASYLCRLWPSVQYAFSRPDEEVTLDSSDEGVQIQEQLDQLNNYSQMVHAGYTVSLLEMLPHVDGFS